MRLLIIAQWNKREGLQLDRIRNKNISFFILTQAEECLGSHLEFSISLMRTDMLQTDL